MATTNPLDYQSELDDIASQRAMIQALRMREGAGEAYPGFTQALSGVGRALFGDPLTKLAKREKAAAQGLEATRARATQDILEMSDPFAPGPAQGPAMGPPDADGNMSQARGEFTQQDVAQRASRAMSAGVPQALIDRAMQSQQFSGLLKNIDNGPMPSQQVGAAAPQGAPQAGGGFMPFVGGQPGQPPGPQAPPQAPQGPPQPGGDAFAGINQRQPTGSPFQNVSDVRLAVLGAAAKGSPYEALITQEAKARELKIDGDKLTRNNKLIGVIKDGILTDATGQTTDLQGQAVAARAGLVKAAETQGAAPFTPITTKQGNRDVTTFAPQIPGYGQGGAQPQGAPAPNGRTADFNLKGATQEQAMQAVQAAYGRQNEQMAPQGAPQGAQPPLGTSADSVEQAGRKAGAEALMKGPAELLNAGMQSAKGAAEAGIPQIHVIRDLLDSGKVNTGMGADFATEFGRVLKLAGLSDGDGVAATQTFTAEAAKRVMGTIKMLGSGSGISDSDREYAAKAVGGNIKMDEGALRRILDIDERTQRALIANQNKLVDKAASSGIFTDPKQAAFYRIDPPAPYVRASKAAPTSNPNIDALVQKYTAN